jgi:RNA polymerase sigma-70 factor (ECF subfamily)
LCSPFRLLTRVVKTRHSGLDSSTLVNDIVHRAMVGLKSFRGNSKLSTWFWTLAQHEVDRALRRLIQDKKRLEPLDSKEGYGEGSSLEITAKTVNLDAEISLEQLMRHLPPEQAEVIRRQSEGYTLEQIAQETGIPLGTVRSRLRLAKQKARKLQKKIGG